jgi:hypothetical protein
MENENGSTIHPGWQALPPEPLPRPTYWPAVMAASIMAILWGIVTTLMITAGGIVLFIISVAGWIGDLRHGHFEHRD